MTSEAEAGSGTETTGVRSAAHRKQVDRRKFMTRLFAASGVAAVATMSGAAWSAMADTTDDASASASASPTDMPTDMPSGGPSGAPGGGGQSGDSGDISEEFFGLTTDGNRVEDLFTIHNTGVSTKPIVEAATAFLAGLSDTQLSATQFGVRSTEWRLWSNVDSYPRQGVTLADLTVDQIALGTALLTAALSADGLETTEKIRKINQAAGEATGNTAGFNEDAYYWTIMGEPSTTTPWGFQFDGHHCVINYFVLGDQIVMSPCFWGSEPTQIDIDGETVTIYDTEFATAVATINALTTAQQAVAITKTAKTTDVFLAGAFTDNLVQEYEGISAAKLDGAQKKQLLKLINVFVGKAADKHAAVKMAEVKKHLDETYFSWQGGIESDSAFYLRVHSPVIWIEFDCEGPGPLSGAYPEGASTSGVSQQHVHCIVRTPNGNDYGRELLRLHYATSPHHQH